MELSFKMKQFEEPKGEKSLIEVKAYPMQIILSLQLVFEPQMNIDECNVAIAERDPFPNASIYFLTLATTKLRKPQ